MIFQEAELLTTTKEKIGVTHEFAEFTGKFVTPMDGVLGDIDFSVWDSACFAVRPYLYP